jgi:hypothetical protein
MEYVPISDYELEVRREDKARISSYLDANSGNAIYYMNLYFRLTWSEYNIQILMPELNRTNKANKISM